MLYLLIAAWPAASWGSLVLPRGNPTRMSVGPNGHTAYGRWEGSGALIERRCSSVPANNKTDSHHPPALGEQL